MVFYFVQKGESLYAIAQRYQTTVHAIVSANRLVDPNAVTPGQALIIPRPGEVPTPPPGGIVHLVRPGESIVHLARRFGTSVPEILRVNQIAHPEFVLPGQQLVIPEPSEAGEEWPAAGRTGARTGASPVDLIGSPQAGWVAHPRGPREFLPSPPVIRYDRVYAGLGDGIYYAFDRSNGRVKWRLPAEGTAAPWAMAAPLIYDGLAYLATPGGVVHAMDAYKGARIWKVDLGSPISAAPGQMGGVLYVAGRDGAVWALEGKTGAVVWRRQLDAAVDTAPAAGDGRLFVTDEDSQVWALDGTTGAVAWQLSPAAAPHPILTPPAAAGGLAPVHPVFADLVLVAGGRGVDPQSGAVLWETGERVPPVFRAEHLYYPGGAVDLFTGQYQWRWAEEGDWVPDRNQPLVAAGRLLLGQRSAALRAWRVEDGVPEWTLPLGAAAVHPPALAPGLLAVSLADGSLCTVRVRPERHRP